MLRETGSGRFSRRTMLKGASATLIVAAVTPAGVVIGRNAAWSATPETLSAQTFAALVQMSRDIYPHPQLEDKIYAAAVGALDKAAKDDAATRTLLEEGVAALDSAAIGMKAAGYSALEGEDERMVLLQPIETSAFFQKVRGNLITGIYNNQEVWPILGYEGESASKGGYINRGFNDLNWL